ncbi:MAG: energy-coupling factor transporter ATPase [Lachnospiraceae bacterium]|nr:energy-coupling factor transporter ATPase [Lachnospiraceae bacterium]
MSLQLQNVSFYYESGGERKQALRNLSLEIGSNELIGLVGQTGSGKSTLLQLLNGLERPWEGRVLLDGRDVAAKDFSRKELCGRVGLVFQYPEHQLFGATVVEDVQFGPRNLGWEPLEVELSAFQALKDVGIGEDLLDVSPLALSGGQKRRVALAGVLAMKPEYLILDEPMAGLDPAGRREVFQMLLKLHRERNMSILFVSHSMEDVAEYAERVIVMHQGKVVLDGAARQIFRFEKELEQIGLRVPQTARFMHRLRDDGFPLKEECITPQEAVECILRQRGKSVR